MIKMAKRQRAKKKSEEEIQIEKKTTQRNRNLLIGATIFVAIILFLAMVLQNPPGNTDIDDTITIKSGQSAPDFTVTDSENYTYDLSGFSGRIVILNIMDTASCEDCVKQMGHLKNIYSDYPFEEVVIISIDTNNSENVDELIQYKNQYGDDWIFTKDSADVQKKYGVTELPTSFIIDKKGKVAYPYLGLTSSKSFSSLIDSLDNVGINTGQIAPNFTLTDINGNQFSLSDYRGRVIVIDLMATWCGPCITEMGHLREIFSKYDHSEVWILSIDVDNAETVSQLTQFKTDYGDDWTFATQGSSVGTTYGVTGIPQMYIIDKDGVIAYKNTGVTSSEKLSSEINKLL
jgi:peroxiredoxin